MFLQQWFPYLVLPPLSKPHPVQDFLLLIDEVIIAPAQKSNCLHDHVIHAMDRGQTEVKQGEGLKCHCDYNN